MMPATGGVRWPGRRIAAAGVVAFLVALAAWLATGCERSLGNLASVTVEARSESGGAIGAAVEHLTLTTTAGVRFRCVVRSPLNGGGGGRYPSIVLQGGIGTGRRAVLTIDSTYAGVAISCDYPLRDPSRRSSLSFLASLPRIRAEVLSTPQALSLAADYLAQRPDVDTSRLAAVGASLGVAPVAAWAATDPRPRAVALVYFGADLGGILEINLRRRIGAGWLRRLVGRALGACLRPLEPSRTVAAVSPRPLLVIGASDDERIPAGFVRRLYDAAREPKRLVLLPGRHVHPTDAALIAGLTDSTLAWLDWVLPEPQPVTPGASRSPDGAASPARSGSGARTPAPGVTPPAPGRRGPPGRSPGPGRAEPR